MRARILLLVPLLALVFPPTALAQQAPLRFERISIEQGLSQVTIYCIFQDSRGLMWFGTEDGLNKYDGYTFTVYKRDPQDPHSLSANTVRAILEDASNALWIGTDGGGLNRFDRATEQFTHFRNDPQNSDSLSSDTVIAIYEDRLGTLWIGTDGGGLDRFDQATGRFSHYRHDPNDPHSLSHDVVTSILEDSTGKLWIATLGGGLNQLDRTTGQFVHYQHNPDAPNSLSNDEVNTISARRGGGLWIGTNGGLNEFDPQTQKFTYYLHDPNDPRSLTYDGIDAVYQDSSGTLWVGTSIGLNELALGGVEGAEPQTRGFIHHRNDPLDPNSLSLDDITALYEDSAGVLWIGTTVGGLNKLDRKMRRFAHYRNNPDDPNSLSSNTVWAIHQDASGALWVGSSGLSGGLDRLARQTDQLTHYRYDPQDPRTLRAGAVLAIHQDSSGALWVGTYEGGLSQLDLQTDQFTHYRHDSNNPHSLSHDIVWALYEDTTRVLWVGTWGGGLDRFDRGTGQFAHYRHDPADPGSISSDLILTIYQDRAGTLWVGTTKGLDKLDRQTGRFTHYKNDPANPRTLSSDAVPTIYQDSSGTLWVGTDDGLNKFDPAAETFTHYTEKDGLANDAIGCILEDDRNYLWISSGKGLSRFNPRTEEFKNYDVRDGLQSNEFNRGACYKNKQGELFLGGINGFNAFYPADIADNPHVPPVILTGFQIFNKPVAIGGASPLKKPIGETDALTLSYQDYVFSFEFAALDYTIPGKNRYAYKLEGFDRDWNYVDSNHRFASYANLPAGAYTFRVKGSNNDGVWNEAGVKVEVKVEPPPWQTWWAYTLYAILSVSIAAAILRYRLRELEHKHLEQTMWAVQSERDRIATLLESRRQLVASISHDLRTPVAIVRGHLESLEDMASEVSGEPPARATPEVPTTIMLQELDRLQALLDDLFTLSRLEVDRLALRPAPVEVVSVARRAVATVTTTAWQQGKVQVVLETSEAEMRTMADEQRLMQVLMNLLHNAVRHTLPGGIVIVALSSQPDTVVIKVQDTGEGIRPDDLPHIWERFYRGQSQAGGGTGLGLALVKELTEAMGGTVAVESTLGEGSCFMVSLPRVN
jgi:signal transduction histidine kinase/ligand-binding sensor domain-containing protein